MQVGYSDITAPTRQVYVVRSESGDRIFAGFREHDTAEFADTRLQASQLPVQLFEAADFLVLGTLGWPIPPAAIAYFTSSGRAVRCQDFTGCELATCLLA